MPPVSSGVGDTHRGGDARPDIFSKGFSLVDMTDSAGREDSIPSARVGEGMLYIEIDSPNPPDTLWITYWEHLLNERKTVTPGIAVPLSGAYGNMFEGSFHKMVYTFSFPKDIPSGFFSLGKGDNSLVRHWYFSSTDRVRIRFDLVTGSVLFGGPDAEFFRIQHRLDRLFAESLFNQNPVIISATRKGLFEDSTNRPLYQAALKKPDDLHVKMQILVPEENGWEFFKPFLESPWTSHPAWEALEYHRNALNQHQFNSLEARIKGEILFLGIQKAELSLNAIKEDPAKTVQFLDWADSFSLKEEAYSHPKLVEAGTGLANLASRIEGKPLFSVLEDFSPLLRDQIIGYYVLDNFNRFGDQLPELLDHSLAVVSTPWIAERLTEINRLHRSELVSDGLWDSSGKPVDLKEFKGKTLLLHFWISGCKFCLHEYATVMKGLSEEYADNPDVVLVSINVDGNPENWENSLDTGLYTSPDMLNLRADKKSGIAPHYKIHSFPQKMIVGPDFKIRLQTINRMEAEKIKELLEGISRQAAQTFSLLRPTYQ